MAFLLYDYLSGRGFNEIEAWTEALQTRERAKLNQRLDMLEHKGEELFPQILCGTKVAGVMKLRVHGPVQLRPLLCRGPAVGEKAYTLLIGAKEVGSKYSPRNAESTAASRKSEVANDLANRRANHERVANQACRRVS